MARSRKDPRHRAREAALQILYQWEVGGRDVEQAAETFFSLQWPDVDAPADELRAFASRLSRNTVVRLAEIKSGLQTGDRVVTGTSSSQTTTTVGGGGAFPGGGFVRQGRP